MSSFVNCPQCGVEYYGSDPRVLCPKCLLQLGMESNPDVPGYAGAPTAPYGRFVPPKPEELARHFPQLEILDLIGQGGMGAVYKARQRGLNRLVALKILPPESATDPEFAERFNREARALARLNHPHIVSVYDSGQASGLFYLIMEFVDGVNLRQAIQTGRLTPEQALAIVPQICDALQYAHDEHVVHRDIKPENVLMDSKGRIKIADFGLARLLNQPPNHLTLTGAHQIMGTPRYMAPEQLEGSHAVDHRADIYSLGVVFYELLTGELPLGRFAPPSKKVSIDVRLDEVVLRALEKEPGLRYQHASDVKSDMESIQHALGSHQMRSEGWEYRSQWSLFGLPLVHVAKGIDRRTGKRRVARGIIAIGDFAVGLIAMGGVAYGGLALGGLAAGLVTLGGISCGLVAAAGGAALGFGVSLGGLAVGTVAVGGLTIGGWALGGVAIGREVKGGLEIPLIQGIWRLLHPLHIATFLIAGIHLVVIMALHRMGTGQNRDVVPQRTRHPHEKPALAGNLIGLGCGLLMLVGFCVLIGGVMFYRMSAARREMSVAVDRQRQIAAEQAAIAASHQANRVERPPFLSSDGTLDPIAADMALGLSIDQAEKVNQIIKDKIAQYQSLEAAHVEFAGDGVLEIKVMIPRLKAKQTHLADEFWNQIDQSVPNAEQQRLLRLNLPLYSREPRAGMSVEEICRPGIFGWRGAVLVSITKEGTWFVWTIQSEGFEHQGKGPNLPDYLQRFWREKSPAAESISP